MRSRSWLDGQRWGMRVSANTCMARRRTHTWPMVTSAGEMLVGVGEASNEEGRAMASGKPDGGDVELLCATDAPRSARHSSAWLSRDSGRVQPLHLR